MARRVYAGRDPKVFLSGGIGRVEPGDVIEVPDALLEGFDRRADIAVPAAGCDEAERELAAARSDGKDLKELPGLPGGDESGTDRAGTAGAETEDVPRGRRRKNAPEAGPLADPAASADAGEGS
jgi:hypothetical protein